MQQALISQEPQPESEQSQEEQEDMAAEDLKVQQNAPNQQVQEVPQAEHKKLGATQGVLLGTIAVVFAAAGGLLFWQRYKKRH